MKTIAMMTVTMTLLAASAGAQVFVHEAGVKTSAGQQELRILAEKAALAGVHVSVETAPVTGAPYSAEATTESVQTLADGNRIVRRTAVRVYRDGKGRTRRETLGPDGEVRAIVISDPATGRSFAIDPGTNTVHHTGVATFVSSEGGRVEAFAVKGSPSGTTPHVTAGSRDEAKLKAAQEAEQKAAQMAHVSSAGAMTWVASGQTVKGGAPKKEDLGQRVIEGLSAKGSRTTTEIPAGAVGNELPIVVTAEEWVSTDLKVLLLTRHADPRAGETTYRLTGIVRGEPAAALFEPPAGVTVK